MRADASTVCRPIASPLGELTDTKRPLASTVCMIGEAATTENIHPTIQPVLQHPVQSVSVP